mgnify:CR=1 FL=1|tara:strand:- start:662 stop:841 length:180 start_codon:yes stop_codon:yes gene_type:complete
MNLNINELGKMIADAQKHAAEMMAELSLEDQKKVNEIVDGVNTKDTKEMENYLNNQKNA